MKLTAFSLALAVLLSSCLNQVQPDVYAKFDPNDKTIASLPTAAVLPTNSRRVSERKVGESASRAQLLMYRKKGMSTPLQNTQLLLRKENAVMLQV